MSNTGQVLTSLAELLGEHLHQSSGAAAPEPLRLLHEALEFFQRCLSLQEYQFKQSEAGANVSPQEPTGIDEQMGGVQGGDITEPSQSNTEPPDEDTWAMVIEPTTLNTLLDTLLTQVETLTSACALLSDRDADDPIWIEHYFQKLLQEKISVAAQEMGRQQEVNLVQAKFRCALADACFRMANIELSTYERELTAAYENVTAIEKDPQALCDRADAEMALNASIWRCLGETGKTQPSDGTRINVIQWKHLTKALDDLTAAGKLPNARNLPRIHLRRGDCEMLRRRLGGDPANLELALKSEPTLLKNAEISYRGAARLAKVDTAIEEEEEALTKEAITASLSGDQSKLPLKTVPIRSKILEIIEDMVEEGLLSSQDFSKLDFKKS
ncbi:MAG: hypothetical protein Q9219_005462 [cf. Caloplaca sp. 3 TL-2023]